MNISFVPRNIRNISEYSCKKRGEPSSKEAREKEPLRPGLLVVCQDQEVDLGGDVAQHGQD